VILLDVGKAHYEEVALKRDPAQFLVPGRETALEEEFGETGSGGEAFDVVLVEFVLRWGGS